MKKITLLAATIMIGLTGCATVTQPSTATFVDKEPLLVGIPFEQRIANSEKKILDQRDVWYRYKMNIGTKEYNMVTHNQNLEARKNSVRTIPQQYSQMKETVAKDERDYIPEVLLQEVNKIEWRNNSANALGRTIADAMGYEFVTNKKKDINVNVVVNGGTIDNVLKEFAKSLEPNATILVMPENKTFNIIYK